MSWHKDHPELIPFALSALATLGALLVKAGKELWFRLVELPRTEAAAREVMLRADLAKEEAKSERLESELRANTKELWQSLKTSEALAQKLERERDPSSRPPRT